MRSAASGFRFATDDLCHCWAPLFKRFGAEGIETICDGGHDLTRFPRP
ncbi:hypothetical protein ACQP2U_43325 (plasmid) [Nocardia sp. CA-084685]